jgi:acetylornithine deacetylase/succinyl-diaminopimelate desuccinylase family protein
MRSTLELLSDLISIPSVNPMGQPVRPEIHLEHRVTDYLEEKIRSLGVRYKRIEVLPGRDNLLAWYEAPHSDFRILLDAHQDTVPVDTMIVPPFEPRTDSGKMFGRGSCDVKSGVASMFAAFERLVRERPVGSCNVLMAFTVDEEYTHRGSSALAEMNHGCGLGIVAEPTRLKLVVSHKGAVRWKIHASGRACHSSTPHLGDNAIYRMGRVLHALSEYACQLAGETSDELLGPPSLSVGRISGGQSVNIVPDDCSIEIDRRLIPGESVEGAIEKVRVFLKEKISPNDFDKLRFGDPWVKMPALRNDSASPFLGKLRSGLAAEDGTEPSIEGVPYGTDAGPLAQAGLPCVVFGPGDIAQAHTEDEWIETEQVLEAVDRYYRLLSTWETR